MAKGPFQVGKFHQSRTQLPAMVRDKCHEFMINHGFQFNNRLFPRVNASSIPISVDKEVDTRYSIDNFPPSCLMLPTEWPLLGGFACADRRVDHEAVACGEAIPGTRHDKTCYQPVEVCESQANIITYKNHISSSYIHPLIKSNPDQTSDSCRYTCGRIGCIPEIVSA